MNTYQHPEIHLLGAAHETILGIAVVGPDMDGTDFPPQLDFAEDPQFDGE